MTQTKEQELIQSMKGDQESAKILAEYLGYEIGKNPVDPDGETRIFFTDKTGDMKSGVSAVLPVKDLSPQSSTVEVRKLYEQVVEVNLVNAKNYGVPQSRERVFIIGIRNDLFEQGVEYHLPEITNSNTDETKDDLITLKNQKLLNI